MRNSRSGSKHRRGSFLWQSVHEGAQWRGEQPARLQPDQEKNGLDIGIGPDVSEDLVVQVGADLPGVAGLFKINESGPLQCQVQNVDAVEVIALKARGESAMAAGGSFWDIEEGKDVGLAVFIPHNVDLIDIKSHEGHVQIVMAQCGGAEFQMQFGDVEQWCAAKIGGVENFESLDGDRGRGEQSGGKAGDVGLEFGL